MTIGRQSARVLAVLESYIKRHGYAPTLREVAEASGMVSTNAARYHLGVLERAGYIRRAPEVSRGIVVLRCAPPKVAERKPRAVAAAASA
jgi:repressor LexA